MKLICTNGHDRCYLGPDENCPYCERRVVTKVGSAIVHGSKTLSPESRAAVEEIVKAVKGRYSD